MSKRRNKDNDIIVSCVGTSTTETTGSCWTVSFIKDNGERDLIVIECGLSQSEQAVDKLYNTNRKMLDGIGKEVVQSASYVLLGHAHIDHIGNLAYFNDDNGFSGEILGSKPTIEIGKQLIKDSVYIHGKNIEYLKNNGKKVQPLYIEPQMYQMFDHMRHVETGKEIILNSNAKVIFRPNSHVLGATAISLYIRKPNQTNRWVHIQYSSDMGCKETRELQPYISDLELAKSCDIFISEATYNKKGRQITKKQAIDEREWLKKYIKQCLHENKRILFATFSAYRAQYLLTLFYEWWEDEEWIREFPIVCDGLLINKVNETYLNVLEGEDKEYFQKVMSMRNLKFNKTYDCTKATLSKRTPGIYLAGSGFATAGRITTYLPQFLGCSKDVVIFTGYCGAEGSIAYKILNEEQKTVSIDKNVIYKRASIHQLKTFSSHIGYDELLETWAEINCSKIIVHHGDGREGMIDDAKEHMRSKNKTTPIVNVDRGCNQFIL